MSEPSTLVVIPACTVSHVHDGHERELGRGALTLLHAPHTPDAPLILTVGRAAFPLGRSTPFGTLADDARAYVFQCTGVPG
jgi:hypothetical protein